MQVKEIDIDEEVRKIQGIGVGIAAGSSSKLQKAAEVQQTMTAQYPAERSAGNDANSDLRLNDLYKNGLLFTAYEFRSRTSPDLRDIRNKMQKTIGTVQKAIGIFNAVKSVQNETPDSMTKAPVANILMPRSKSDNDNTSHKFNDVGESLITRGNGTATGVLSNVASTSVFGSIESMTQGIMADHGEQIYNTARSMYAGAENRTKTYTWELTPRNVDDLVQIIRIFEIFNYYSYGITGNSQYAKELKGQIDEWYKKTFIKPLTPDEADTSGTIMESVTSFLSNVIVVTNPTIWFIRNFGSTTKFDGRPDVFGPAQISNIRFDKAPDGNFNGLAVAPNMPSTFVLEVTFREILTLSRGSLYGDLS